MTALLRFGQRDASRTVRVRCSMFWMTPRTLPQFFVRRALRIIAILTLSIRFLLLLSAQYLLKQVDAHDVIRFTASCRRRTLLSRTVSFALIRAHSSVDTCWPGTLLDPLTSAHAAKTLQTKPHLSSLSRIHVVTGRAARR